MNSIDALVKSCQEQTELYSQRENYDPSACFELWRMAIIDRNERAWVALLEQYSSYVRKWIQQRLSSSNWVQFEEEDVLINGAFINVYRFLTPEKFNSFNGLPSILQYVKMCCGSVVADYQRDLQARKQDLSLDLGTNPEEGGEGSALANLKDDFALEQMVLGRVDRTRFWQEVWSRLDSPADQHLVYLRYVLDMPPREIVQLYPNEYPTVQDVYRRNKNLLWRLRNTRFSES